ncbi:hypothetical protein M4D51_13920 [Microbacterium sp. p3-SID338]|uniref:hypothetical protein n=1 Tax=unclassified Microbacterium TaxID=2609290 RepID=UPI000C8052FC|nr:MULTISPECIES: hypothetical protein [unclassified Microbacterium]MCT1396823.1 hypothetical protein [Microbacterium sp. p3-SID338]PMC03927.1 hypothetical protein CJ226_07825 [Microbacterium sp. UMB0228]
MRWPWNTMWRPVRRRRRQGGIELRWLTARSWTQRWYPQGIDVGERRGRRALAVSWFRQDRTGRHLASRVVLVDRARARRLDIVLALTDDDGVLQPAPIHAGGLAWFGDRLFAAATGQGIWEFDLGALRRVHGEEAQRARGGHGRRDRRTAVVAVRTRRHPVALRCSFLGRVFDADGTPLPRVLIGEYRGQKTGAIGEFTIPEGPDGAFAEVERFTPGIPHMQGAVRWGDRYFVSQSDHLRPGVLWSGRQAALTRHPVPLPVGCEDLALDPDDELLWTLGEHPWRRVVRGIPFASLGLRRHSGSTERRT